MRRFMIGLVSIAISLLVLEGLLRWLDPMAYQVRYDSQSMIAQALETAQGYQVPADTYDFWRWSVTIRKDGTRLVPDTQDAPCQLVILGDSVSFGYGVNDAETYANQLAKALPEVQVTNAAQIGYNSNNIRAVYEAYPDADAFVYLIVDNDWQGRMTVIAAEPRLPQVSTYLISLWKRARNVEREVIPPTQQDIDYFLQDIQPLFEDSRALIATYKTLDFVPASEVDLIVPITSTIAPGDNHPNAAGHRDIADQLRPLVEQLIREACS